MREPAQGFRIPTMIPQEEHVAYCVGIIEKQRAEVTPLRRQLSHCHQHHISLTEATKEWKEKYHQEKKEKEQC